MSSIASEELRKRDPDNRLFARQSSYRLPAEFVRDNALAVSGLLDRTIGGAECKALPTERLLSPFEFSQSESTNLMLISDARQSRRGTVRSLAAAIPAPDDVCL